MNQANKKNSFEDMLRDKHHKDRANEVFLKLLAKHKRPANPFDKVRSHAYAPKESLPGVSPDDII